MFMWLKDYLIADDCRLSENTHCALKSRARAHIAHYVRACMAISSKYADLPAEYFHLIHICNLWTMNMKWNCNEQIFNFIRVHVERHTSDAIYFIQILLHILHVWPSLVSHQACEKYI